MIEITSSISDNPTTCLSFFKRSWKSSAMRLSISFMISSLPSGESERFTASK